MHIEVSGTRLWFDVDGPALAPDGPAMRERPTVVLLHGGPGSVDHSYLKPEFALLGLCQRAAGVHLFACAPAGWPEGELALTRDESAERALASLTPRQYEVLQLAAALQQHLRGAGCRRPHCRGCRSHATGPH